VLVFRVKLGNFCEALIPLLTYYVLCDLTSKKTFISHEKVNDLLRKGRKTKRVCFKNFKEKLGKVCQCVNIKSKEDADEIRVSVNCK